MQPVSPDTRSTNIGNSPILVTSVSPVRQALRRALQHKGLVIGGLITALVLLAALLSLVWTPHAITDTAMDIARQAPSRTHWLGTDSYGRDVLSQLMVGAQASIAVGVIAVGIGLTLGTLLGLLAASAPGWLREVILRGADFTLAFPAILSAILLTAIYGPSMTNAIIAIGIYNIPGFARIARAAAASVWQRDFVAAARTAGKSSWAITWQHVLPNIASLLIVQATIRFAVAILAEAGLSYLGVGTQPPQVSWGRMLAEGQTEMFNAPLLAVWPGLAIAVTVLGLNLLGDGLRDVLDPRLARQR
ncbi:peptide ABC transporter permease [Comamonas serinivorans]|uniref:Peptide ABC transporter permease n=1 Tax=Comamonas serinivorans TaxID=1082851 RepID=A0A1Y0ESJ1_9BURK|nr:peptide ABC transporter permease [Comamonas serinivorans]